MKKIKDLLGEQKQLSYSQFVNLLTPRENIRKVKYFKSERHKGDNLPCDYFKPISQIFSNNGSH